MDVSEVSAHPDDTKKEKKRNKIKLNLFKKSKKSSTSVVNEEPSHLENPSYSQESKITEQVRKHRKIGMSEKDEQEREQIRGELKEIIRAERLYEIQLF